MKLLIPIVSAIAGAALAWFATAAAPPGESRTIAVEARQYAFDPPRIHVNQGDEVRIRIHSSDVVHGFYLEGHDINATVYPQEALVTVEHPSGRATEQVKEIVFKADRRGKFRYRCSHTCGSMHPFMTGELIVGPNVPVRAGLGAIAGLVLGLFVMVGVGRSDAGKATDSA